MFRERTPPSLALKPVAASNPTRFHGFQGRLPAVAIRRKFCHVLEPIITVL